MAASFAPFWGCGHAETEGGDAADQGSAQAGVGLERYRRPVDRRRRPQRWHDAVAELVALQAEYLAWFEALPEATRDSATGEALQAILGLDLDELAAIEPPRGFGRD
jgi:hypothetical protein